MAFLSEQYWTLCTPVVQGAHLQTAESTKVKAAARAEEGHLAVHDGLWNRQHQGVAHCAHVSCSVLSQLPEEIILSLHPAWNASLPVWASLPPSVHSRRRLPGLTEMGWFALHLTSCCSIWGQPSSRVSGHSDVQSGSPDSSWWSSTSTLTCELTALLFISGSGPMLLFSWNSTVPPKPLFCTGCGVCRTGRPSSVSNKLWSRAHRPHALSATQFQSVHEPAPCILPTPLRMP